jgi:hypothetical protein
MEDDEPYIIDRPNSSPEKFDGKLTLKPVAKYWAQEHGMSLEQMARWLLTAEAQRQAGLAQRVGES